MELRLNMNELFQLEKSITDSDDVFGWIRNYKSDLGKLPDEQIAMVRGWLFRKAASTGEGTEYETLKKVAEELGCNANTLRRSINYMHGMNAISERNPDFAEAILCGTRRINQLDVQKVGISEPEERAKMIDHISSGERIVPKRCKKDEIRRRKEMAEIVSVSNALFSKGTAAEYTIDSMLHDLKINALPFINQLRQTVFRHAEICRKNKKKIITAITENITARIEEIEKEIISYE